MTNNPEPVVLIDPQHLQPLPKELWGTACSVCEKPDSRWEFIPSDRKEDDEAILTCSACFLYDSNWGAARRVQLDDMIEAVEQEKGIKFMRDAYGRLAFAKDADAILASIAITSRMFQMRLGAIQAAQHAAAAVVQNPPPQFARSGREQEEP